MGLLILPFILLAFVLIVTAVVLTIKSIVKKEIAGKQFLQGIVCSLAIYGIIILCYKLAGSAWALGPAFIMPLFLSIVPFGVYLLLRWQDKKRLALALLVSIIVSGILMVLFYKAYFDFFDHIGVEKIY